MRVLATRRNMAAPTAEADALGVEMADLDTVLRRSDVVSLHLPLGPGAYHLIDADALARMRPGSFLVNTSRGALVDEVAGRAHARLEAVPGDTTVLRDLVDGQVGENHAPLGHMGQTARDDLMCGAPVSRVARRVSLGASISVSAISTRRPTGKSSSVGWRRILGSSRFSVRRSPSQAS